MRPLTITLCLLATPALADKIGRRPVTCEDLGRDRYKRIIARCAVAGEDWAPGWCSKAWPWPIAGTRSTTLTRKLMRERPGVVSGPASS